MKHYYVDPTSGNLIIRDTEKNDLLVVERIESVRVMTKGEIRIGDFDGPNRGTPVDKFDEGGGYENSLSPPPDSQTPRGARRNFKHKPGQRACSLCKKPGHQKRTCPERSGGEG